MTPPASLSLVHRLRRPKAGTGKPPLLLLLHGVGSNEDDLFELQNELDPRFMVLSARGPRTLRSGSYAWFDVQFGPNGPLINPQQAESSRQHLLSFIPEAVSAYEADPTQVYLMGFSQGAIMSASVALTDPERVAGAVLMSGRILPEIQDKLAPRGQLARLPILLIHGTEDATLPIANGRASRDLLTELGVNLRYREFRMGHQVTAASLAEVNAWFTERLKTGNA
jgi:phospholipase/carboxylesterase